jgi:hypothetical protein
VQLSSRRIKLSEMMSPLTSTAWWPGPLECPCSRGLRPTAVRLAPQISDLVRGPLQDVHACRRGIRRHGDVLGIRVGLRVRASRRTSRLGAPTPACDDDRHPQEYEHKEALNQAGVLVQDMGDTFGTSRRGPDSGGARVGGDNPGPDGVGSCCRHVPRPELAVDRSHRPLQVRHFVELFRGVRLERSTAR